MESYVSSLTGLSAIMTDVSMIMTSAYEQLAELSGLALTPYEATKLSLFGKDYEFPTIDEIEVPEEITTSGLIKKISEIQDDYQCVLLDNIVNPENYQCVSIGENMCMLAELSAKDEDKKTYVVTEDKYKSYIEYLEIIQQIDLNSINQQNCNEIIRKLGYVFVNTYSKKTI
jgi:hypothetical protein